MLRPPAVGQVGEHALVVDPSNEPGVDAEVGTGAAVEGGEVHVPAHVVEEGPHRLPDALDPLFVAVPRLRQEDVPAVGGAEPHVGVEREHPAVAVHEAAVRERRADERLRVEVEAGAADGDVGRLAERRVRRVVALARRLVVGEEHADRTAAHLAAHLPAVTRIDDGPGVDRRDRREDVKDLLPLQEERPQLGIEERKALVDVDLRQVRFDLREIGVDGEVGRQVGRDAVLQVEPGLGDVVFDERTTGIERAETEGGDRRQDFEVAAGRQIGQPFDHPHLGEKLRDVPRDRRPDDGLVLPLDRPRDLEPPAVRLPFTDGRVAQALERNRQLGGPAVRRRQARRDEQCVPGDVAFRNAAGRRLRGSPLRAEGPPLRPVAQAGRVQDGIPLHAETVHRELIGALAVPERVEEEGDRVVFRNLVAIRTVGPNETGTAIACPDADVEVLAVVGDVHVGRLAGGGPLDRSRLHEVRHVRGPSPDVVGEPPVDVRRLFDADRGNDRLPGGVRRGPEQQRQRQGGPAGRSRRDHGSIGVAATIPVPSSIVIR